MPTRPSSRTKSRGASCVAPALVRRAGKIAAMLKRRKLSLVTAESCTAGLVAAALSQAEGATDVLAGGFVTYTKDQKTKALGVSRKLLAREGAVTTEVARRMAAGALKRSPARVALAVTGVLGPEPDEDGNPVGLVCFCAARERGAMRLVEMRLGRRSHDILRHAVVMAAFDLIETVLKA